MSQLEYYAKRVATTKGLEHQSTLRTLRNYLRYTPPAELVSAVEKFTKDAHLKALWEAGLNDVLQKVVLRRLEELKERRE